MGRPILSYLAAAALCTLGFGVAGGCAESESMLVIRGVIPVAPPECVVSADSDILRLGGTLDVRIRSSYEAALQVSNQLMSRGDKEQLRAETSRVTITGAEVRVSTPGGSELANFTVVASGSVDPGDGDAPGLGVVYATLIPNVESYSDVENPIVTEFQVFGSTVGGQEVWSNWFTYPIYLEDLVYYPSESIDDTTGLCTGGTNEDLPCAPGQDDPLPCSYCLDQSFCLNPASS